MGWMSQRPRIEANMTRGGNVNIIMPNDILLYLEIGTYPNRHHRGFMLQLKETDAAPQPNIRQSSWNPAEGGRKDYRSQKGQGHKKTHIIN